MRISGGTVSVVSFLLAIQNIFALARNNLDLWSHDIAWLHLKWRILAYEHPDASHSWCACRQPLTASLLSAINWRGWEKHGPSTFNVALTSTDFTIVSAKDLSNYTTVLSNVSKIRVEDNKALQGIIHTCCNTFMANCGVIAPLVMSSSSESVRHSYPEKETGATWVWASP